MYKRHGKIKYNIGIEACKKISFNMRSLKTLVWYSGLHVFFLNTILVE